MITNSDEKSFKADVLDRKGDVLVDFWATWCAPCSKMGEVLEVLSVTGPRLPIVKVDIDKNPNLRAQYGVKSIPTLMVFRDGAPIATRTGSATRQVIAEWIEEQ